jgi:hypothetical protein
MNSVDVGHTVWDQVWNAHDGAAVDRFVVEDFKKRIEGFLAKVDDLHLEVIESFQNADGKNSGFLGRQPDQRDISMTGTAVWAVREDGKLLTNWVERASWEVHQRLTTA